MNYHNITTDDMLNGDGLRIVLWVSGCSLECKNCQNPQTWDFNSGITFTDEAMNEILESLNKPYISGLTLTGGHPLEAENLETVKTIVQTVKTKFPQKTIWLYTGFRWENISRVITRPEENGEYDYILAEFLPLIDVVVDGRYIDELRDITLPFRGSSNQRVIDVQKSLKTGETILWQV